MSSLIASVVGKDSTPMVVAVGWEACAPLSPLSGFKKGACLHIVDDHVIPIRKDLASQVRCFVGDFLEVQESLPEGVYDLAILDMGRRDWIFWSYVCIENLVKDGGVIAFCHPEKAPARDDVFRQMVQEKRVSPKPIGAPQYNFMLFRCEGRQMCWVL